MGEEVILLDSGVSPFGLRVRIALAEKRVNYERKEENLDDKSPLLLQSNPVQKKIPVLIHNGRPICESLVIVQYIDEVWNVGTPLLPEDPVDRARASFWADFVDKKVYNSGSRIWRNEGEIREAAKQEFLESLKLLEAELGAKPYFGGERFGYVDIALLSFAPWFYTYETYGNFSLEEECPQLMAWVERCRERESVFGASPHPHNVYDEVVAYCSKIQRMKDM
ncbi:Glutathione S-transferase U1 [Asimina triloba]